MRLMRGFLYTIKGSHDKMDGCLQIKNHCFIFWIITFSTIHTACIMEVIVIQSWLCSIQSGRKVYTYSIYASCPIKTFQKHWPLQYSKSDLLLSLFFYIADIKFCDFIFLYNAMLSVLMWYYINGKYLIKPTTFLIYVYIENRECKKASLTK